MLWKLPVSFSHLIVDFFRSIHRECDVHIGDGAQIISILLQLGSVCIDRKEDSLTVDVLQEFDNSFEEKGLTAADQNKSDFVLSDFINQAFQSSNVIRCRVSIARLRMYPSSLHWPHILHRRLHEFVTVNEMN